MDDVETALDRIEEMSASGELVPYEGPVITTAELGDPERLASDLAARFTCPVAQAS